jgi:peptidoglycan hydrolase-like protein with peptidoglycan-binding domain
MPLPLVPIALGGGGLIAVWKLFFDKKVEVQTLKATDDAGNTATVAVPVTSEEPVMSQSVTPPTSDNIAQVPSEESLGVNTVVVRNPDGGSGFRHFIRRFIAPPVVPGMLPLAPTVFTPYGPAPMVIRSPQDIQYALNALGHGPLKIDGYIGPRTTQALIRFQEREGLARVGLVPETRAHLQNAIQRAIPKPTGQALTPGVHVGEEPVVKAAVPATPIAVAAVSATPPVTTAKAVQVALNKTGANPPLKVDGQVGPKTVAATKAFQVVHGLLVDGVPGPKTQTALAIVAHAPRCRPCVPTPYRDMIPMTPILRGRGESFLRWAEKHHLDAVDPRRPGPQFTESPKAPGKPWGPVLTSRNEKFLRWGALHHLQSLVNCHKSPFGFDASFPNAHGQVGGFGCGFGVDASFDNAHDHFGFDMGLGQGGGDFQHAHASFGAAPPPPTGGGRGGQVGAAVHVAAPSVAFKPPPPTSTGFGKPPPPTPYSNAPYGYPGYGNYDQGSYGPAGVVSGGGGGGYYGAFNAAQSSGSEQNWVDRRDYRVAEEQAEQDVYSAYPGYGAPAAEYGPGYDPYAAYSMRPGALPMRVMPDSVGFYGEGWDILVDEVRVAAGTSDVGSAGRVRSTGHSRPGHKSFG